MSTTGFRTSLRDAVSHSLELASEIVLFFVRFVIVMLPVLVFAVLPSGLVLRYVVRRAKRMRLAEALDSQCRVNFLCGLCVSLRSLR